LIEGSGAAKHLQHIRHLDGIPGRYVLVEPRTPECVRHVGYIANVPIVQGLLKCRGTPERILQVCHIGYVPVVDGRTATVVETHSATERGLEVGALAYIPRTDILVKGTRNPEHSEDTCHVVGVPITNRLVKGIGEGERLLHGRY
jgi:hypothetical protein